MDDLIKRDDAIKAIECRFNADIMDRIDAMLMTSAIAQITKNIANIPSADKQGEWIDKGSRFECSNCNCPARYITPFCPQCGARMRG